VLRQHPGSAPQYHSYNLAASRVSEDVEETMYLILTSNQGRQLPHWFQGTNKPCPVSEELKRPSPCQYLRGTESRISGAT
jgi:hypothetical protein